MFYTQPVWKCVPSDLSLITSSESAYNIIVDICKLFCIQHETCIKYAIIYTKGTSDYLQYLNVLKKSQLKLCTCMKLCLHDINHIYAMWIKNRSDSDPCSCEAEIPRLQWDSNPWPLRYCCSTLPTELWSLTEAGQVYCTMCVLIRCVPLWWHRDKNVRKFHSVF